MTHHRADILNTTTHNAENMLPLARRQGTEWLWCRTQLFRTVVQTTGLHSRPQTQTRGQRAD